MFCDRSFYNAILANLGFWLGLNRYEFRQWCARICYDKLKVLCCLLVNFFCVKKLCIIFSGWGTKLQAGRSRFRFPCNKGLINQPWNNLYTSVVHQTWTHKKFRQNSATFVYLQNTFPRISYAKIKDGVFVEPHIRELIEDVKFEDQLSEVEDPNRNR